MAGIRTAEELVALIKRSGLASEAKLDGQCALLRTIGQWSDAAVPLAQSFIDHGLITVFQAKQLLLGRHRGFDIGKYRVLEGLGSGGMSHVFLCQHKTMGHRVAVKLLPESLARREPATIEQLFHEARAAASLNHPNVVRAHDIDRHGSHYYMVMDFVDGVSLHELTKRRGAIAPPEAATMIAHAACGLQHIHEAGLVHRDVKPGNLMLDKTGTVRMLDLGLAIFEQCEAATVESTAHQHGIMGTADFLAPEQALGSGQVDIRADIYSLGVTCYFLLAGKAPFEDLSLAQKLVGHQYKTPPAPPGPPELIRIVDRMMAKNPAQRYQTPADLLAALAPFVTEALQPPTADELPKLCKAASGPATTRSRSTTGLSMATLRKLPSMPAASDAPIPEFPAAAHAGPRAATRLVGPRSADDTQTPASAATVFSGKTTPPIEPPSLQEDLPSPIAQTPVVAAAVASDEAADGT